MTTPPASAAPPSDYTRAEKILTMMGILLGLLLAALDQTIVATAGPAIQVQLHIEPSVYPWITTAYMVTSTMMVPVYGKLSDLFGRKPVLIAGIVIFLGGSIFCGFSQTTLQLILARGVQGFGSAALFTSAFAVIADIFPPAERGKYQGLLGGVFALSSVVGPLTGGFITDHFGWHWVFFVNAPLGAIALAFIFLRMPTLKRTLQTRPSIDVAGALCLIVAVVPLLLALSLGKGPHDTRPTGFPWQSWQILTLFGVALSGSVAFIAVERRAKEPLIPLGLFRDRTFAVSNAASFVSGMVFFVSIIFLPLFMTKVVEITATFAGLTITPLTLGLVVGNIVSGQAVSRLGRYRWILIGSMVLAIGGFILMALTLTTASTRNEVALKMVLLGLGLGPAIPLFTLITQNAVEPRLIGVATSSVTFFRSLGGTMGLALYGTIFGAVLATAMGPKMQAATADLPPAIRARFANASSGVELGEAGGDPRNQAFPVEAIKQKVKEGFARAREGMQAQHAPPEAQAGVSPQVEARALDSVDKMRAAFRESFAEATRAIYWVAVALALLALLITAFIPELPLRRHNDPKEPLAEGAQAAAH